MKHQLLAIGYYRDVFLLLATPKVEVCRCGLLAASYQLPAISKIKNKQLAISQTRTKQLLVFSCWPLAKPEQDKPLAL